MLLYVVQLSAAEKTRECIDCKFNVYDTRIVIYLLCPQYVLTKCHVSVGGANLLNRKLCTFTGNLHCFLYTASYVFGCHTHSALYWCGFSAASMVNRANHEPRLHHVLTFIDTKEGKTCPSNGYPEKINDEQQDNPIDATLKRIMKEELYNLLAALVTKVEHTLSSGK